jgi:hypothetical protein
VQHPRHRRRTCAIRPPGQGRATFQRVEAALRDPAAAADAYFKTALARRAAAVSGGRDVPAALAHLGSPAALKRARAVFKRNLRDIARLNRESGDALAYGITGLTHLTQAEFKQLYLSGFKPNPRAAGAHQSGHHMGALRDPAHTWPHSPGEAWASLQPPRVQPFCVPASQPSTSRLQTS